MPSALLIPMNPLPNAVLHRPQVHGHRGCRGLFPENTLPAFLHALQLGVDVLELDVVISADQQVVVAHEPWLSARLGLSPTGQRIDPRHERDYNLYRLPYEIIRQSALGVLPHPLFPEQQLVPTYRPLLSEVLEATAIACQQLGRPAVGYSIEVKSTPSTDGIFHPIPARFTELVLTAIPSEMHSRMTILSFDPRILRVVRQSEAKLRVSLLTELPFKATRLFEPLGFTPDVFGPDYRLLTQALVQELRATYPALQLVPWTINQSADLARMIAWQVAGVTTDYPNRLLELLH